MHKMLKSVPVTLMLISYIPAFSVCYSITYIVKFSPQKCGVMCLLLVFFGGGGTTLQVFLLTYSSCL